MLKKNQRLTVRLEKWGEKGLSKGGMPEIQIPYVIPGETVQAHITKAGRHYAYAKAVSILEPSKHRVTPPCPIFTKCGGCQLQHVEYSAQLRYKQHIITEALTARNLTFPGVSILGCERQYAYRNKATFSVSRDIDGALSIGLSAPRSQRIVDCSSCAIQHPLANAVLEKMRLFLQEIPCPIHHVVTRIGVHTDELMVAIVSDQTELPNADKLIQTLRTIPQLKSLYFSHNPTPEWTTLGEVNTLLWGAPAITEKVTGLTFSVSPQSFFQANTYQLERMWECVAGMLDSQKTDIILELYCGTGSLGIFLAQTAKRVIGIELNPDAIHDAQQNALQNNCQNIEFYEGDVDTVLPTLSLTPDAVVVDPPRKGLTKSAIDAILRLHPPKVIYVSCAPDTLARDLVIFCENGYEITEMTAIDMFAQTHHVETVVRLKQQVTYF